MKLKDFSEYIHGLSDAEVEELEDEGAMLIWPPRNPGYEADPEDYVSFMSTGGDGVHFSLPKGVADGPILMVVPMQFDLGLGCVYGYFALEQLVYNFQLTVDEIVGAKGQSRALKKLSEKFSLKPWDDVEQRLLELNK
jgi:hypothetical protein